MRTEAAAEGPSRHRHVCFIAASPCAGVTTDDTTRGTTEGKRVREVTLRLVRGSIEPVLDGPAPVMGSTEH